MKKFEGIYPALVTPLTDDGEALNRKGLEDLVEFDIQKGANGICALGGTGEFCGLSDAIRDEALEATIEKVNGRVPVLAGFVCPGYHDTVKWMKKAKAMGADFGMVVTPFYVTPTQQGLVDYYCRVSDAVDLPIVLYNVPARTGVNFQPETVAEIVAKCNVVGIKECTPSMVQAQRLADMVGDKISVFSGEDYYIALEFTMGFKGGILASAPLVPELWADIYAKAKAGDFEGAIRAQKKLNPLLKVLFSECNPGPLKEALKMRGIAAGSVLPPLRKPSDEIIAAVKKALEDLTVL